MDKVEIQLLSDVVAVTIDINGYPRSSHDLAVLHRWWSVVGDAVSSIRTVVGVQLRLAVVIEAKPPLDGDRRVK